ncbi:MAG: Uma2 family endonuclease [Butyrivibrio sp.]|nr:Uma2 family endonuclease [Butyrivibrio sp.]
MGSYTKEDYYATPEGERVELVRGLFRNMAAPGLTHQRISMHLSTVINNHIREKGLQCEVFAAPFDVDFSETEERDTILQPDISVICDQDKLTRRGCMGAPDFIIEISSPGYFDYDNGEKRDIYRRAGVKEYWIVDPAKEKILVYLFHTDREEELRDSDIFLYGMKDMVPVHICENFTIDFADFDLQG